MEIELNGAKLKVYENGTIERFIHNKWKQLQGSIDIDTRSYKKTKYN